MTLDEIFKQLSDPKKSTDLAQILPLPIAHLFSARTFDEIIVNRALEPKPCKVFDCNILYFSYGGVFHRYDSNPTNEATKLPVAILFNPQLLSRIDNFFPYDTGAAKARRYADWSDELTQWNKYQVSNYGSFYKVSKLIHYLYGSNEKYLSGQPYSKVNFKECFPMEALKKLMEFLTTDLTKDGVDYRQRTIECQTSQKLDLTEIYNDILWIGLPDFRRDLYENLCNLRRPPSRFQVFFYKYRASRSPNDYIGMLDAEAQKIVDRYLQ